MGGDAEGEHGEPLEGLLSRAVVTSLRGILEARFGDGHVGQVEQLWERENVLRVETARGHVVVKLARALQDGQVDRGTLQSEAVALTLCTSMQAPVAPRLIGFDAELDLVVMEELPPGRTLAEVLLLGDAASADDALQSLARALATLHAHTATREGEFAAAAAGLTAPKVRRAWLVQAREEWAASLEAIGSLVPTMGVDGEIEWALAHLEATPYRGLVHGDLCPDNLRFTDEGVRIFDYEASSFGPIALDAAYFLAPFPSCWCFAAMPPSAADSALAAYREELARRGLEPTDAFEVDLAAALACFLAVRLGQLPAALTTDGTVGHDGHEAAARPMAHKLRAPRAAGATFPRLHGSGRGAPRGPPGSLVGDASAPLSGIRSRQPGGGRPRVLATGARGTGTQATTDRRWPESGAWSRVPATRARVSTSAPTLPLRPGEVRGSRPTALGR